MAIAELIMPKMGESIIEATILHWHKKVGDPVKQDETVLDIATDKVDSEIPSTVTGIVTELLFNENDVVLVGSVIAKIKIADSQSIPVQAKEPTAENINIPGQSEYISNIVEQPDIAEQNQVPYIPQQVGRTPVGNNRFFSPLVLNIANSEGLSLSELERITGTGADGRVSKKDIIIYISDKKAGNISPFVPYQQQTPYNPKPVIHQVQQRPEYQNQSNATEAEAPKETTHQHPLHTETKAETVGFTKQPGFSSASVTSPAELTPIQSPINIAPEEKEYILPHQPVQKQFRQPQPIVNIPAPEHQSIQEQEIVPFNAGEIIKPGVEIIQMDRMRKLIAKHMVDSKHTSAHVTSFAEADVTNMVTWRNRIKHDFEQKAGTKITFTPMFIECLVKVMKRFPIINSSVIGDTIAIKSDINIGMATALPDNNLIVPVIKHAESMGLVGLAKSVNSLADNARHNKLKPEDIQEGTFTFTNVGTFGSLMGTPIINQPQVAILAVGIIKKRPVVIETESGDFIGIRHMIYLSLSYDHRIIDGSVGSSFLSAVAKEFENWDVSRELKLVVKEQYVD